MAEDIMEMENHYWIYEKGCFSEEDLFIQYYKNNYDSFACELVDVFNTETSTFEVYYFRILIIYTPLLLFFMCYITLICFCPKIPLTELLVYIWSLSVPKPKKVFIIFISQEKVALLPSVTLNLFWSSRFPEFTVNIMLEQVVIVWRPSNGCGSIFSLVLSSLYHFCSRV